MMKAVAATLLIFFMRFAYLHAESASESDPVPSSSAKCTFDPNLVTLLLFNGNNPHGKNISFEQHCDEINKSKPVAFITHGFTSAANISHFYDLATALMKKEHTVFNVDWSDAACTTLVQYSNAVGHTHEVAKLLANYIITLSDQCKVPLSNIMLIGHSLGAHISGFTGKRIHQAKNQTVARIFGVDPAGPSFHVPCEERLCTTDAERVLTFHSSLLGYSARLGHLDFYFNSQWAQPSCWAIQPDCSHSIPFTYLANTVNDPNCVFLGRAGSFQSTPPYPDSSTTDCVFMSSNIFDLTKYKTGDQDYYLWVKEDPFCVNERFNCKEVE